MINDYDIAVIGAGIVGLAVTREIKIQYPDLRLAVLDQEDDVAQHQTGHNSGVIHSGVYYKPGSLKARLCVDGARLMYEYCDQHGIPYEACGKLIVALDERELPGLEEIERRGHANGVPGLRRLDRNQIAQVEPGCRGVAALHCPSTGIVDYKVVARTLAHELRAAGVALRLGEEVTALSRDTDTTTLTTSRGSVRAGFVVTCAGLWSDRVAVAAGAPADPRIVPFRGAYLTLRSSPQPVVRGLVYPVPDPELPFLGVHITRQVDGRVTLGPTAMLVPARRGYRLGAFSSRDLVDTLRWRGSWRLFRRYWRTGIQEMWIAASPRRFVKTAARYVPAVADIGVDRGGTAGVRAQALAYDGTLVDDFVISETPGAIHLRNAPSPAATSSLALARELVTRFRASPQWAWNEGPGVDRAS